MANEPKDAMTKDAMELDKKAKELGARIAAFEKEKEAFEKEKASLILKANSKSAPSHRVPVSGTDVKPRG